MQKRNLVYFLLITLTVVTFILLYLSFFKPISQDEGVFLTIANGILNGKAPHRDFFDHKPPGIYFLFAPIIDLFGKSIWALRGFLFLNNFFSAFLVYKITNLFMRSSFTSQESQQCSATSEVSPSLHLYEIPGIYSALLYLYAITFYEGNYLIAEPFMATFLLAAIWVFLKETVSQRGTVSKDAFFCGIMIGLATLMKQTAIVNFFILGYFVWKSSGKSVILTLNSIKINNLKDSSSLPTRNNKVNSPRRSLSRAKPRGSNNNLVFYLLGTVLPWIPFAIYLFANNALKEAFNQIVTLNFTSYPRESIIKVLNSFLDTSFATLILWIPFLSYFFIKNKPKNKTLILIMLFAMLPVPLFFVRHYPHYLLQILPFVVIIAGIQLHSMLSRSVILAYLPVPQAGPESLKSQSDSGLAKARQNDIIRCAFVIIFLLNFYPNYRWYAWVTKNIDAPKIQEQKETVNFINETGNNKILAENQFTGFYFLTDKEPLTKYLYITEVNSLEKAEQITIEKLKQNPDTIILWPKDPKFAYAKELQNYILKNYRPVKEYEKLELIIFKIP